MKQVTREQWTTALRSGDFKQAQGTLYNGENGYCCLGVLGKLIGAETVSGNLGMKFDGDVFNRRGCTPDSVNKMLRLDHADVSKLIDMNDSGESFAKIADYIDKLPFRGREDG